VGLKAERTKKAIVVPGKGERQDRGPLLAWASHGGDDDGRDPSEPLAVGENGEPLYFAPRGFTFRWWS
jgi:hypothetical protein